MLRPSEEPDAFIDDLVYLQGRLAETGTQIGDDKMITQILSGLPQTYSEVVTVLSMQTSATTNDVRKLL